MGLDYYGMPGLEVGPDTGFQYCEPPEEGVFMRVEDYEVLVEAPTGYLFNVWLPRVSRDVVEAGELVTWRNNMSLLKGGMAMLSYFVGFGAQAQRLRQECGTVSAITGILKAPLDILGDKLRGYVGLTMNLHERPKQVVRACEARYWSVSSLLLMTADQPT